MFLHKHVESSNAISIQEHYMLFRQIKKSDYFINIVRRLIDDPSGKS